MSNRQRNLYLGGAIFAGGAAIAGAIYLLNKNKEGSTAKPSGKTVPKDKVIAILKEIQREMFPLLTNISMIALQIKEKTRGRAQNNEIKDYLLHQNPQTKNQIQSISDNVCKKYGVDEKDLKHACEVAYTDDKEIRVLLNEAKTSFDKAFNGKAPDLRTEIPPFLTPEKTLDIMKKIMKETLYKIRGFFQELKSKGIVVSFSDPNSMNDPRVLMGLEELNLEGIKLQIAKEEGLDGFEDSPLKIFQFASQKYSTEDEQFTRKFMKLEMQNQQAMEAVMKDQPNAEIVIEAVGSHLVKNEEELTVSSHFKNATAKAKKEKAGGEAQENSEDEEIKALGHIKELRHQVSMRLKSTLEDSSFPEELVQSAVNTLFNVFDKIEKTPSLRKSGRTTPKNAGSSFVVEAEENAGNNNVLNGESENVVKNAQAEESQNIVVENKNEVVVEEKAPVVNEEGEAVVKTVVEEVREENKEELAAENQEEVEAQQNNEEVHHEQAVESQ